MNPYYKSNEEFVRYLEQATIATKIIEKVLKNLGHDVRELEYGVFMPVVFKLLPKGARVPDLVCVKCGRKFEVRSKKKLEISMSHSDRRPWDAGLDDTDIISFLELQLGVKCRYLFVEVKELREKEEGARVSGRKGRQHGSEARLIWKLSNIRGTFPKCIGEKSSDEYIKELKSNRRDIRFTAARVLGYRREKKAISDLKRQLQIEIDPIVASAMAVALAYCGDHKTLEDYINVLPDEQALCCVLALIDLSSSWELDILRRLLDERRHEEVRFAAAIRLALANCGDLVTDESLLEKAEEHASRITRCLEIADKHTCKERR